MQRERSRAEHAVGGLAARYLRVPYVLGADNTAIAASGSASGTEARYRNDADYPMEIRAVGFSLRGAHGSSVVQSYRDVGIAVRDVTRDHLWQNAEAVSVGTLVELAANSCGEAPGGPDIFAFNGVLWRLRRPTIIGTRGILDLRILNYDPDRTSDLIVSFHGSLLTPATGRFADVAARMERAVPYGAPLRLPDAGVAPRWPSTGYPTERAAPDRIVGYEFVPHVLHLRGTTITTATPTVTLTEASFRNRTAYDLWVYEVGVNIAEAMDSTPNGHPRDVSIQITDVDRDQPWHPISSNWAGHLKYAGSRMDIGQGAVWHGVKWDLGPGTLIPPQGALNIAATNNVTTASRTVDVSLVGMCLVPVIAGTSFAEAYARSLLALP